MCNLRETTLKTIFLIIGENLMYSENRLSRYRYSAIDTMSERFHVIFLMDAKTGLTFLSKKFSKNFDRFNSDNEDLISGFLNALNYFVKELDFEDESIEDVNFKNNRILYKQKERLMAVAISKKTDIEMEHKILSNILNDFYQSFKTNIENFTGDVKVFESFKQNLNFYNRTSGMHRSYLK